MEKQSSMETGSGWWILIRAHDHIWRDHGWSVSERMAASQLLWDLSIKLCAEPEALLEAKP